MNNLIRSCTVRCFYDARNMSFVLRNYRNVEFVDVQRVAYYQPKPKLAVPAPVKLGIETARIQFNSNRSTIQVNCRILHVFLQDYNYSIAGYDAFVIGLDVQYRLRIVPGRSNVNYAHSTYLYEKDQYKRLTSDVTSST